MEYFDSMNFTKGEELMNHLVVFFDAFLSNNEVNGNTRISNGVDKNQSNNGIKGKGRKDAMIKKQLQEVKNNESDKAGDLYKVKNTFNCYSKEKIEKINLEEV